MWREGELWDGSRTGQTNLETKVSTLTPRMETVKESCGVGLGPGRLTWRLKSRPGHKEWGP